MFYLIGKVKLYDSVLIKPNIIMLKEFYLFGRVVIKAECKAKLNIIR